MWNLNLFNFYVFWVIVKVYLVPLLSISISFSFLPLSYFFINYLSYLFLSLLKITYYIIILLDLNKIVYDKK